VLPNNSVLPAKLVVIVILITLNIRTKILVFFLERKFEALPACQNLIIKSSKTEIKTHEVCYRVIYHIALAGEAHTVPETLIKLCAVEVTTCVLGEQSKKKLETVQLSSITVKLAFKICQQI
jgi:hypothetical protein